MGDDKYLHDQSNILKRILHINQDLKHMLVHERVSDIVDKEGEKKKRAKEMELKNMSTMSFRKS